MKPIDIEVNARWIWTAYFKTKPAFKPGWHELDNPDLQNHLQYIAAVPKICHLLPFGHPRTYSFFTLYMLAALSAHPVIFALFPFILLDAAVGMWTMRREHKHFSTLIGPEVHNVMLTDIKDREDLKQAFTCCALSSKMHMDEIKVQQARAKRFLHLLKKLLMPFGNK